MRPQGHVLVLSLKVGDSMDFNYEVLLDAS